MHLKPNTLVLQYSIRLVRQQPTGVRFSCTDVNSGEHKEGIHGKRDLICIIMLLPFVIAQTQYSKTI
jgi:hypothetical protein